MERLLQDLRFSLRLFRRQPLFTLIVVSTLALGIGANTTIFSIVSGVLLQPLPFPDADRLVVIYGQNNGKSIERNPISQADFLDWQAQNHSFARMGAFMSDSFNLGGSTAERLTGLRVSGNYFATIGVEALSGRVLTQQDDQPDKDNAAVISYQLWQRNFGGAADVINRAIVLNDEPYTIVGVMPENFALPGETADIWLPIGKQLVGAQRQARMLSVVARLRPETNLTEAESELNTIAAQLAQQYPESNTGWTVQLFSLQESIVGEIRPALLVLAGAVVLVLLIACANVTHLLLAQANIRQPELAIRAALGANNRRLFQQLLTESLVLSFTGGMLGLLLALYGIDIFQQVAQGQLPRLGEIKINFTLLGFTLLLSIFSGLLAGIFPAIQLRLLNLSEMLKEGSTTLMGSLPRQRLRSILIVMELSLAVVLLVGAGLLIRSFSRLLDVQPGFNTSNLLTMQVNLRGTRYREIDAQKNYIKTVLAQGNQIAGVSEIAAISQMPLNPNSSRLNASFVIEGQPLAPGSEPRTNYRAISASYFHTMEIPLLRGRDFTDQDQVNAPLVAIINESMAKRYFGNQHAIGQRINWQGMIPGEEWHTIVGVVADVKTYGLEVSEQPAIYVPYTQRFFPWFRWTSFVVRTKAEPLTLANIVREQLIKADVSQPLYDLTSGANLIEHSLRSRQLILSLLSIFAGIALLLAGLGVYGVISYSISQRTREIGIRVALGAKPRDILLLVMRQGITLACAGIGLGLLGALIVSRAMGALLFSVNSTDPLTFIGVVILLGTVTLLACYLPARRALRVDPLATLKS